MEFDKSKVRVGVCITQMKGAHKCTAIIVSQSISTQNEGAKIKIIARHALTDGHTEVFANIPKIVQVLFSPFHFFQQTTMVALYDTLLRKLFWR